MTPPEKNVVRHRLG